MTSTTMQESSGRLARRRSSTAERPRSNPATKPAKPRALVVEDEIFVAWHLEATLRELNFTVCGMAPDGQSAVDKARKLHADLILMDINLQGDMDGIEAVRQIQETQPAPVIFITAYSDPTTLSRIRKIAPGAPVLAKPVSLNVLRAAVSSVMTPPA
ncbi:MAG: response regulator [Rhizobiales bacterium]|jgi:CheY-like chemotaxis protein|nr:response regulator [Hyphomicrobiales bacterium]